MNLDLLEVHGFLDDLVVVGQFLACGEHHEDAADLPAGGVPVVHHHLPQLHHGPRQPPRVGLGASGTCTLLTLGGREGGREGGRR